jgi:ankyrin repeat protein/acetyl esterase/lipase
MIALLLWVQASPADAAERADWPRVEALLRQKADANAAQVDGMTALHWAAHHAHAETVRRLLAAGANPGPANRYGVTPLSLACVAGDERIVTMLLEAGAAPNTTLPGGESALMTAARTGRPGPVKALLDRGADVGATDAKGQTALMWAAADGHAAVVEMLVVAGADPRRRLKSGFTPLLFAAREGRLDVVRVLLKAGVDPNEALKPKGGMSALLLAVENGHFELAAALVEAGAKPNDLSPGVAPLHALTWVRKPHRGDGEDGQPPPQGSGRLTSLQLARELVRRGADPNLALETGESGQGRLGMKGATPFLLAARRADLPYMKLLVELGADPLRPNAEGCTPLMAAAGIGTLAPTEEAGTEEEAIEAVEYLLSLGADLDAVDRNGETPMHGAAYKSLPKVVELLAARGAKIEVWNRKNRYGWTPLMIAEGFRPGNFKPSVDTIAAIHRAMRAAGIEPPPPTPRTGPGAPPRLDPWAAEPKKIPDIVFAQVDGTQLRLDLILPPDPKGAPLVVWVHGDAWRSGSRKGAPIASLAEDGFAVASVDYRLSPAAPFPAQVHDIKTAIRFLRGSAERYGYDGARIAIAGASAGGHLAALVGVTNGHAELEGTVGAHAGVSSNVQAIVDYYGPTNLQAILKQSTPQGLSVQAPALELLLGGPPDARADLAALASPVTHVDDQDPPLLMIHGDSDPQVPIDQSRELLGAYRAKGRPAALEVVRGGAHGGSEFHDAARLALVREFLARHLRR